MSNIKGEKEIADILEIIDVNFNEDVLSSTIPVIVDYWAPWCGPCKMIGPIFADVAKDYVNVVKFAKINVDENPETPTKFGVRGIPTLMIFKDGAVEATKVGAITKSQLKDFIDSNI